MSVIWALADLHLSFGVPNKEMDPFGQHWVEHFKKIEKHWREQIRDEDLVLIPGDISWAMRTEDARPDLEWIGNLPGTKVLIRGNHDYWWESLSKIKQVLPASCHLIQNNSFNWQEVSIGGARMWDTPEYSFDGYIEIQKDIPKAATETDQSVDAEKIFERELGRLEMSLKALNPKAKCKIVMTHYPPIGPEMKDSRVSRLLEKYGVNICIFGHLHNVRKGSALFGEHNGIFYALTAADYLDFKPLKIYPR